MIAHAAAASLLVAVFLPVAVPRVRVPHHPVQRVQHPAHYHVHHLQQALADLQAAKTALAAKNAPAAARLVAAAAGQVEAAAKHHHAHHIHGRHYSGLTGHALHAAHAHHQSHLQRCLADLRATERQISAGNAAAAVRDIDRAEIQILEAVAFHHRIIGR